MHVCDECSWTRWIRSVLLFSTSKTDVGEASFGTGCPVSEFTLWFILSALDASDMFVLHDWLTRQSEITAWLLLTLFMNICTLWHSAEWPFPFLYPSFIHSASIFFALCTFTFLQHILAAAFWKLQLFFHGETKPHSQWYQQFSLSKIISWNNKTWFQYKKM